MKAKRRLDIRISDISPELHKKIKALAKKAKRKMHKQAEYMLEEYVKEKGL